jgi:hypothetical protein
MSRNIKMQPKGTQHVPLFILKFCKCLQDAIQWGGGNLVNWSKIGSCTVTACLVKLPLQGSSFWWRTKRQRSSNYLTHQISLHATSVTSQGPRPDSEIIILHLQKKLNRILQRVSEPYEQMTSRDASSNGRTARASCMCRSEVLPGWLSYILYTSISVWIMTAFQELSDRPT